jgi:hypothetical protein
LAPWRSRARACRTGVAATAPWCVGPHDKAGLGPSVHAPLDEPPSHRPSLPPRARHASTHVAPPNQPRLTSPPPRAVLRPCRGPYRDSVILACKEAPPTASRSAIKPGWFRSCGYPSRRPPAIATPCRALPSAYGLSLRTP